MKRMKGWVGLLVCLFLVIGVMVPPSSAADEPGMVVGRIYHIEGDLLRHVPEEKDWVAVVKDAPFGTEDALFSGERGMAELIIPNGTWIRIGNSTQIQFIALDTDLAEIDVATGVGRFYNKSSEDPLEEDDFEGFTEITKRISSHVIGDDFFVNSLERLTRGVAVKAASGMVLKPIMVGTISEALTAARYAADHGYVLVGSCRAGGTVDDPIPEVSVAAGATVVKLGAPRTGERVNLQNCLLRVEEELGASAVFAGSRVASPNAGPPAPFRAGRTEQSA